MASISTQVQETLASVIDQVVAQHDHEVASFVSTFTEPEVLSKTEYELKPKVLSKAEYLGLCEPMSAYTHYKGMPVEDVEDIINGANETSAELEERLQKESERLNDAMSQVDDLHEELQGQTKSFEQKLAEQSLLLEKLQKQLADLSVKEPKEKKVRVKKAQNQKANSGGANANLQATLQKEGNLAPFREGGCKCRTWGDRLGTQCSNKDVVGGHPGSPGFCKMHSKKIDTNGGWHLGFYDELRPENWGDASDYVPKWEKRNSKIGWSMDEDTYAEAFDRCIAIPLANVDEDAVSKTASLPSVDEDASVKSESDLSVDDDDSISIASALSDPVEEGAGLEMVVQKNAFSSSEGDSTSGSDHY